MAGKARRIPPLIRGDGPWNGRLLGATAGAGGPEIVREISLRYGVEDINFIKPGIGETARVLLRRVPWKIIVNEDFARDRALTHIYQLADEKNVPCGISKIRLGN